MRNELELDSGGPGPGTKVVSNSGPESSLSEHRDPVPGPSRKAWGINLLRLVVVLKKVSIQCGQSRSTVSMDEGNQRKFQR